MKTSRILAVSPIVWAVTFTGGAVALVAGRADAAVIQVGSSCPLDKAVLAANTNMRPAGTNCTAGNDTSTLASGNPGDIVQLIGATGPFSTGAGLEIYSKIEIKGTSMGATSISVPNNAGPSGSHGITLPDCNNAPSGFYVASTVDGGTAQLVLHNVTLQGVSGTFTAGVCSDKGATYLYGARVTGFNQGGLLSYAQDPSDSSFGGSLYVYASLIDANRSPGNGAGIQCYTYGCQVVVDGSSIVNNFSEGGGGGISVQPQVGTANNGPTVTNSTISGNTAIGNGGGILIFPAGGYVYAHIYNTTIANNHATVMGGGVFRQWSVCPYELGNIQLDMSEVILTNNIGDSDHEQDNLNIPADVCTTVLPVSCSDSLMFLSGPDWTSNVLPTSCSCNFTIADAKLATLAGQGGANNLPVHALKTGSPALDWAVFPGSPGCTAGPGVDQRGVARPQFGATDARKIDLGAIEMVSRMETENLTVAAKKSGVTHVVVTATGYSNGKGTNLQASSSNWSNPNAFVTYTSPSQLLPGTYSVVVGFKKGSNEGQFQFAVGETLNGTYANLGGTQDSFSLTNSWVSVTLPNVTLTTTSSKFFRFTVTGKNTASSSYQLFPDFVTLTKQ